MILTSSFVRFLSASLLGGMLVSGCGSGYSSGAAARGPARLLLEDSFEAGVNPAWVLTTLPGNYDSRSRDGVFVRSPLSAGSFALQYRVLRGQNEVSPANVEADPAHFAAIVGAETTDEAFFEWQEFFEPGYPFPTSSQKLVRFGYDHPDRPASKKELGVLIQAGNGDLNLQYFCGAWGNSSLCSVDGALHTGRPIATGRWVRLGLWVRLNTPGESNGLLELFEDGEPVLTAHDLDLRGNDPLGYNFMWLGGNYSNLEGGKATRSGSRFIDDARWYSTLPEGMTP